MKRVYFSEAKSEKRGKKIILFAVLTLVLAGGVMAVIAWMSGRSEALYNLVDSQKANAQENAADAGVDDNNAGRPDDMAKEDATGTAKPGEAAKPAPGTAPPTDAAALAPPDSDAEAFKADKMSEIQSEIMTSLKTLRDLQKALDESLTAQTDKTDAERMKHLAKLIKIVNSMRPEDAGRMLDKVGEDLVVKILASLTGGKASKIMASMDPEKAARLGELMVELKPEPKLRDVMNNWQNMVEQEESANAAN